MLFVCPSRNSRGTVTPTSCRAQRERVSGTGSREAEIDLWLSVAAGKGRNVESLELRVVGNEKVRTKTRVPSSLSSELLYRASSSVALYCSIL